MSARPAPELPLTRRLLAALADVPQGQRPHFGKIARLLRVRPAEVTVAAWALVGAGLVDRHTLRPVAPPRPIARPYCQHPEHCVAGASGPCRLRCNAPDDPKRSHRAAKEISVPLDAAPVAATPPAPRLKPAAVGRLADHALVWCGQCDRRVTTARALGCTSQWCKAELPPQAKECRL
jgi:hypothetical protein